MSARAHDDQLGPDPLCGCTDRARHIITLDCFDRDTHILLPRFPAVDCRELVRGGRAVALSTIGFVVSLKVFCGRLRWQHSCSGETKENFSWPRNGRIKVDRPSAQKTRRQPTATTVSRSNAEAEGSVQRRMTAETTSRARAAGPEAKATRPELSE